MAEIYGFRIDVEGNAIRQITAIDERLRNVSATGDRIKSSNFFGDMFKFSMLQQGFEMLKNLGSKAFEIGKNFEQTALSFKVMTGSAETGRELTASLKQLADTTPMVDSSIYDAGRMLLNYGINAKDVAVDLKMLGDVSGGDTERFNRLTYAFSQISAAGKLQGQDLRQLIDAGFNPLKEISEKTGVSYSELQDKMAKGQISFNMVAESFKRVTSEGGRFYGMMEQQSQTVGGLQSTFFGSLESASIGVFQKMTPVLKDIFSASTEVANSFAQWITPKQSEVLSDQYANMNALFAIIKDSNTPLSMRKDVIAQLNAQYKDYLPSLITEQTSLQEINGIQNTSIFIIEKKIKALAMSEVMAEEESDAKKAMVDVLKSRIVLEKAKAGTLSSWESIKLHLFSNFGEGSMAGLGDLFSSPVRKAELDLKAKEGEYYNLQEKSNKSRELFSKLTAEQSKNSVELNKNDNKKNFWELDFGIGGKEEKFSMFPQSKTTSSQSQNIKSVKDNIQSATSELSSKGASGGLGEAKVINITINKMMEINADKLDGKDVEHYANESIDILLRELGNITSSQGYM